MRALRQNARSDRHSARSSDERNDYVAERIRLVGIAGSLRERSLNRALLETARDVAPTGVSVDVMDIADIPLYNADLDADGLRPAPVETLKRAVANADGLLLATPEYNYGISGVMKNVIDWVSRPGMRSPLAHKPIGIMGASPGAVGTARAQEHLKVVLFSTMAELFPHPGVVVGNATGKFTDGRLTDEKTREFVRDYLSGFVSWLRREEISSEAA